MNEPFVTYLFSKFHKELGFDHILSIWGNQFPDCTAVKDGSQVEIEFENKSESLATHLTRDSRMRTSQDQRLPQVSKTQDEIIVIEEGFKPRKYSTKDFEAYIAPNGYTIRWKILPLDYCVCWKKTHDSKMDTAAYSRVKFIELMTQPVVIEFMKTRKASLESLGIKVRD